jgi:glucuronoarabinoxylan endo-1,4-beta-xylanase
VGKTRFGSVMVASALFVCGCGSNGIGTGTGGSPGSGGTSTGGTTGTGGTGTGGASGGTTGTGGFTGTGGNPATGGVTGTGGHATGGTTGNGGSTGTGGTSATGGTTGTGGATGTGGMAGAKGTGGAATGGTTGAGGSATGGVGGSSAGAVTVQLDQTEQLIQGFGINDNWGTQFSSSQADALFGTTGTGIGLSILRTGMSDSGSSYNSFESSQISTVKNKAGSNAKIIGSVWSPPASCKTNNNVNDGGHLMSSCYDSWSTTIANWASSNGLYAMSIGNEPDFASCGSADPCNGNYPTTLATATEMVAWVKAAGPKLKAKSIKVIAPEASEWLHTWSNVSAGPDVGGKESSDPFKCGCYPDKNTTSCSSTCTSGGGYDYGHYLAKDATAWAAFDILGVHQYDSQVAVPWPSDVNGGKPNKEVWQTEMSGVKWWPEQGPSSDINNGVAVAGWIHSALVDGQASAWLWWWYQASGTDDNEGLFLKSGGDTKRHYTLGNYSKFVRPGYTRVDITGSVPSGVLLSAFKGSDGTVVVVAINKSTGSVTVPISIAGGTPASCTPNVTSSSDSLVAKTAVAVSGGGFSAVLASATVTSFVCK